MNAYHLVEGDVEPDPFHHTCDPRGPRRIRNVFTRFSLLGARGVPPIPDMVTDHNKQCLNTTIYDVFYVHRDNNGSESDASES